MEERKFYGRSKDGEIYNFRHLRSTLEAKGHRFRTQSDTEVIVVVYEVEGRLICHRVLRRCARKGRYAFLTKGDNWRTTASWIRDKRIIGKVMAVEGKGRLRRLDPPVRSLHARGVAILSCIAAGSAMLLRWGRQFLRERGRGVQKS